MQKIIRVHHKIYYSLMATVPINYSFHMTTINNITYVINRYRLLEFGLTHKHKAIFYSFLFVILIDIKLDSLMVSIFYRSTLTV